MRKMVIIMMFAAMAAGGSGCMGTSALQVRTAPAGAKLYANGKYIGVTPASVPVDWGYFILYAYCDATRIKVEKEGYQPVEKAVTRVDLGRRNRNGGYFPGSPFGSGRTYPYLLNLDPVK